MAQDSMTSMTSMTAAAVDRSQKVMDMAQDAAERAGVYAQKQLDYVSERTRDLARVVSDGVQEYSGWSADAWSDARDYVQAHPFQALAAMAAVGYVLGKFMF